MIVLQLSHSHHDHLLCQRNRKRNLYTNTFIQQHADAMHHNRRIDYLPYTFTTELNGRRHESAQVHERMKKQGKRMYTLNNFLLAIIFLTMKNATLCLCHTSISISKSRLCTAIVCCCFSCKSASSVVAHHTKTNPKSHKNMENNKNFALVPSRFYCRMVINYLIN